MRDTVVKWMISLYPKAWRDRYGEEFLALLEEDTTAASFSDLLLGALDARLQARVGRVTLMSIADSREVGDRAMNERMRILLFGQRDAARSPRQVQLHLVCATLVGVVVAEAKGITITTIQPQAWGFIIPLYLVSVLGITTGVRASKHPLVFWAVAVGVALIAASYMGISALVLQALSILHAR